MFRQNCFKACDIFYCHVSPFFSHARGGTDSISTPDDAFSFSWYWQIVWSWSSKIILCKIIHAYIIQASISTIWGRFGCYTMRQRFLRTLNAHSTSFLAFPWNDLYSMWFGSLGQVSVFTKTTNLEYIPLTRYYP